MKLNRIINGSLLFCLSIVLVSCGTGEIPLELKRAEFYRSYYNNDYFKGVSFEAFMDSVQVDSRQLTKDVHKMLGDTLIDMLGEEREAYLGKYPNLPLHIKKAIEEKYFITGMTLQEFWLSVGDSTILYKTKPRKVGNLIHIDVLEEDRIPYFGRYILFVDEILESWGIS